MRCTVRVQTDLDPVATRKIEDLMQELKKHFTIGIVTHNLQQAKRVADKTGFLYVNTTQGGHTGYLVEFGPTEQIFDAPKEMPAQEYIQGAFS
jgi:phosphate transport system ATP-binding protein